MSRIKTNLIAFAVATLTLESVSAQAAPITVPAGLNPGDTYRLAFVTSTVRDATSSDIADYNAFVSAAANSSMALAGLGTTWTAIASTVTVDARDNTATNPISDGAGSAIYNLNGDLVATSNADFWDGDIAAPIDFTESGAQPLADGCGRDLTHQDSGSPISSSVGSASRWAPKATLVQPPTFGLFSLLPRSPTPRISTGSALC